MKFKIEVIITSLDVPEQESIPEEAEIIFECSSDDKIKSCQQILLAIASGLPELRKKAGLPDT